MGGPLQNTTEARGRNVDPNINQPQFIAVGVSLGLVGISIVLEGNGPILANRVYKQHESGPTEV